MSQQHTPLRPQPQSNQSSPSVYSQPGGTPDHTHKPSRLRDKILHNLPTGDTPPRPSRDLFADERKQRQQAMLLLSRDKMELNNPSTVDSKWTNYNIKRKDPNEMRAIQAARRTQRYAAQQTNPPDSKESSASTSRPSSATPTSNNPAPAHWVTSLRTGSPEQVSPAFLAAMKRMSVASSSSGVDAITLQRVREAIHSRDEGHQPERLSQETEVQTHPARPRRRYSDRRGPDAHDPTLVSDEPSTSFNPYVPSERYRYPDEVNPYATERYGDLDVRLDMRRLGRVGHRSAEEPEVGHSFQSKDKGQKDTKGKGMRKSWERLRKAVGLVDPDKAIAQTCAPEGWENWEEVRTEGRVPSSTDPYGASARFSGEPDHAKQPNYERKGSASSLFSLGGSRKVKDRREVPFMEPLYVPTDRNERIAMGPTLAHTPRDWKMNDGHVTRMRAGSPVADSLRHGMVDERARRGESPPPKDGPVRRLVRRASGPLRRTLSKISLKSKKSTENLTGGEDFFLPSPTALGPARPERHSCYLACVSSLIEDVHKFDECFCDCPGCRPQERRRPQWSQ
ncbi:hypothetical protein CcaverHIS002_0600310 [Cutaneotrichosporon cavernicola]|uniref:Uncharacterized protein n=1 Tax=Cutaneotrichosporon cavernicola TaxID=279322 RepID=A0AA48L5N2_9TREE|nr:uncharacterized protein CcaverHIS019_0500400 [Cutaneotrichosporon cavernicola]BEI85744.1 hypothetical protein CcaverHIS002_0600310 [Cutaneotrichosporon cavernicola]BEI92412.1 hypothetical protein CcaverHIS019_0500400 [Cutaneotrichosporon cavernicola]BEJ00185.1 hypothetical protein CcaverHIS631_0500420 [Cutaneotrichosporon cavernicola]BEJ07956.1 hypothetical protein CcaverHIS641_0500410 [Cutaneotrichosporon cavernicola]